MQTLNVLLLGLTAWSLGCSDSQSGSNGAPEGGAGGGSYSGSGAGGVHGGSAGSGSGSGSGGAGAPANSGGSIAAGGGGVGGVAHVMRAAGTNGAGMAGASGGTSMGGATSGGACDKSRATWTDSADNYASKDFGGSFLRKNFWNARATGSGSLTLWAVDARCWGVDAMSQDTVNPGTVKSYPDMARGWVVGTAGFQNPNSGLPIQVSALKKAKIRWKMSVSGNPLRHYALWDIYFHESAEPGRGTAPVNLMIKQRVVDPDHYEQDTESGGDSAVTHTFSGITFRENKNTGLKSGSRIVVELFATPVSGNDMGVDDMTLDLKEVIDHYVQDGSILSTDYLTSIQAGWEVVAGGTFVTHDFWTALQDEPEPGN